MEDEVKFMVTDRCGKVDVCYLDRNCHGGSEPQHWLLTEAEARELSYRLNKHLTDLRRGIKKDD